MEISVFQMLRKSVNSDSEKSEAGVMGVSGGVREVH